MVKALFLSDIIPYLEAINVKTMLRFFNNYLIQIYPRSQQSPDVQQVLSKYGSLILLRSGIPYSECDRGLINLTMSATPEELENFKGDLSKIKGLKTESLCLVDDAGELNVCDR